MSAEIVEMEMRSDTPAPRDYPSEVRAVDVGTSPQNPTSVTPRTSPNVQQQQQTTAAAVTPATTPTATVPPAASSVAAPVPSVAMLPVTSTGQRGSGGFPNVSPAPLAKGNIAARVKAWHPHFASVLLVLVMVAVTIPVIIAVVLTTVGGNKLMRENVLLSNMVVARGLAGVIEERLVIAERMALDLDALVRLKVVSPSAPAPLVMVAMSTLRTVGRASAVYITTPDGYLYGAVRKNDGEHSMWTSFPNHTTCQIPVDADMVVTASPDWCQYPYYGNRFPWYTIVDTGNAGERRWTQLYWSHEIYVTYSVVTYVDGVLAGVSGADWILGSVKQLLADTTMGKGIAIIVEANSHVFLAATDPSIKAGGVNQTTGMVIMYNVSDIDNELIRTVDREVIARYRTWRRAANVTFWIGGNTVVSLTPIYREGLFWILCAIGTPELVTVEYSMLGATLGITIVLVLLAIALSTAIVRPLRELSDDMTAISRLRFDVSTKRHKLSFLREIRDMQKSFLRLKTGTRALTRYIAPEVVMDVMRSESGDVFVDMKEVKLTILFTDLRGFTSLSEQLDHSLLIYLLNLWLEEFGHVVQNNHGTIDKFIGDCIMALYGAPIAIENTEAAACSTALEFADAMGRVNAQAVQRGAPLLEYRVGIHTGQVLLGNLGYEERVNYTVCGNPANIASRMEQLGKEYCVTPIITGEVFEKVKDKFLCVFLDIVFLRGHRVIRTRVYHLAAKMEQATPADYMAQETFNNIHKNVSSGHLPEAVEEITKALDIPGLLHYVPSLKLLLAHVRNGTTGPDSYQIPPPNVAEKQPLLV